jgi:hypothetical protein
MITIGLCFALLAPDQLIHMDSRMIGFNVSCINHSILTTPYGCLSYLLNVKFKQPQCPINQSCAYLLKSVDNLLKS